MKHIAKFYTENQIFYVDQKDNQLVCYCYETSGRKELSLGVVAGLIQSFFNSSKEKFLKKEGFYDVYVNEETGYHHFYQNGKQDIFKFFQMNGEDALLYKDLPVDDRIKQFHYQNSRVPYTRYISMMIDLLSVTAFFWKCSMLFLVFILSLILELIILMLPHYPKVSTLLPN